MSHKSSELKKRCQLAKQRLKMGYWENMRHESAPESDSSVSAVRQEYVRVRLMSDTQNSVASALDEKMYKKVCAILDRDEIAINPIGQLIDEEVYGSLDHAAKQRYILELSNKFRELKDRYYRERTGA